MHGPMDDESTDVRLETDAYDDKGRGDEVEMELQSMEGPGIDCRPTMAIYQPSKK